MSISINTNKLILFSANNYEFYQHLRAQFDQFDTIKGWLKREGYTLAIQEYNKELNENLHLEDNELEIFANLLIQYYRDEIEEKLN